MMIRKIHLFLASILFCSLSGFAGKEQDALDNFLKTSGVISSSVAIKVVDLSDSEPIAVHNTSTPLIPASILKSATTGALLEDEGENWNYHTRVFIDGPTDMGMLRGNLIITGSCDPSLHTTSEPYSNDITEEIAAALKGLFISRIEGQIIIDESEFCGRSRPESWQKADFTKYYGTGSHAFNFSDNASGDRAVENPGTVFKKKLIETLSAYEIPVDDKNLGEGRRIQILDHLSAPVDEIMRSCMMRSDNLYAECMLRTFGKKKGTDGSTAEGAKEIMKKFQNKGYPLDGVEIVDGSGLSRQNRVTADFMAALLEDMSGNATYASFFPLAGQEGTLRKFLAGTELDSYMAMKTGSMNGIQCYAGYKLDDDYVPTHVVVIIMNDLGQNRDRAKKAVQKMLLEMFVDND